MKAILLFSIFALLLPEAVQARHRRTTDFAGIIVRSATYDYAIKDAATRFAVDPRLLWTIAYLESRFRPRLVSPKGARGMMQFMPATGRKYGLLTVRDLNDPLRSIEAAAKYLRDLNEMFNRRIDLVLAGYNAGENAVITSGYRVPRYRETRNYVARGVSVFRSLIQDDVLAGNLVERTRRTSQIKQTRSNSRPILRQPPLPRTQPARSIYFRY